MKIDKVKSYFSRNRKVLITAIISPIIVVTALLLLDTVLYGNASEVDDNYMAVIDDDGILVDYETSKKSGLTENFMRTEFIDTMPDYFDYDGIILEQKESGFSNHNIYVRVTDETFGRFLGDYHYLGFYDFDNIYKELEDSLTKSARLLGTKAGKLSITIELYAPSTHDRPFLAIENNSYGFTYSIIDNL